VSAPPPAAPVPRHASRLDWVSEYLARLHDERVLVRRGSSTALAPAHTLAIDPEDWEKAGAIAAVFGCRWAAFWGDPREDDLLLRALLEHAGGYLVLETAVPSDRPRLASLVAHFPAADRAERHARDLLGLEPLGHPNPHRWTRHQAWPEARFTLTPGLSQGRRRPRSHAAGSRVPVHPGGGRRGL
jgi:hypothetical protein